MKVLGLSSQQWRRLLHVRWDDVVVYTVLVLFFCQVVSCL